MRTSRPRRFRHEQGQAYVLSILFLTVLLGMSAAVLDVGAWYRAQRHLQASVDAAALAGAQALPDDPGLAISLANQYLDKNGGAATRAVGLKSQSASGDSVTVTATRQAPGIFSKMLGINSVRVGAKAVATGGIRPSEVTGVGPIAVDEKHAMLQCKPLPCFNQSTTLDLKKTGPGAFRLVNIDGSKGGTGPPILADWIQNGYSGWMPLGWYNSDPGAKFNSSQVKAALDARLGDELLFPVYRGTKGQGANFEYEVIGWVGFVTTGYDIQGSKSQLFGYFTRVIWQGIQGKTGGSSEDFGVRSVSLTE
jgi:putative Flp pilus-assembly TadE/G-like protein